MTCVNKNIKVSTFYHRSQAFADGRGGGRGRGRGHNYQGATRASEKGLSNDLGSNVFDYGHKVAPDQIRTTWEKMIQHVGSKFGQDMNNELLTPVVIDEPTHTAAVPARHAQRELVNGL